MGCIQETEYRGETLYLYNPYCDGNPYVLRNGDFFEVIRTRRDPEPRYAGPYLRNDEYTMRRMTITSQHDIPYWIREFGGPNAVSR